MALQTLTEACCPLPSSERINFSPQIAAATMLLARCKHSAAKRLLQEARDAQNLHEITDLLLDETPRDTRERLKPTQINRVVRARRCRGETATDRRLLVVAASALAAKGRIETCSG